MSITLETTLLILGGAAVALVVVLEREEERLRLYRLPKPGADDLEPEERKLALQGYGAAQALLNAIAESGDPVREGYSQVAAQARRLAALHLELVRAGRETPLQRRIPAELESAREAVLAARQQETPSGDELAALLQEIGT